MKMLKVKIKKPENLITMGVALPTKLKLFSYTLYSTRKLMCELEHHRSHKKEVHLFGSLWVVALYNLGNNSEVMWNCYSTEISLLLKFGSSLQHNRKL